MTDTATGRLAGKAALITGGAGGIGVATARRFLDEGARVALLDQDEAAAQSAVAGLGAPDRAMALGADATDAAAVARRVAALVAAFSRLDTVVNNAAARAYAPFGGTTEVDWDRLLAVNVVGADNLVRATFPHLRAAGRGAIVNASSAFALSGRRGMGGYVATKGALVAI